VLGSGFLKSTSTRVHVIVVVVSVLPNPRSIRHRPLHRLLWFVRPGEKRGVYLPQNAVTDSSCRRHLEPLPPKKTKQHRRSVRSTPNANHIRPGTGAKSCSTVAVAGPRSKNDVVDNDHGTSNVSY
jgi:hypothetical protein